MKISVCITVFNEEKNISHLVDSLLFQTKKASEIVFVDGGSSDNTVEILKKYQKKTKILKVFTKKGSISVGRNEAIRQAGGEIIVTTDAGCVAQKDWLAKITQPFVDTKVNLVAGFYTIPTTKPFNQALASYLGVSEERYSNSFLPSARSMAFRKTLWKKIGGFKYFSRAGEDTRFVYDALVAGFEIVRVKNARVEWGEVNNLTLSDAIKKFYFYALGDSQSKISWNPVQRFSSHNIKIFLIYSRYLVALILFYYAFQSPGTLEVLVIFAILYMLWPIYKKRKEVFGFARLYLPVIQIASDLAVMTGFACGLIIK